MIGFLWWVLSLPIGALLWVVLLPLRVDAAALLVVLYVAARVGIVALLIWLLGGPETCGHVALCTSRGIPSAGPCPDFGLAVPASPDRTPAA